MPTLQSRALAASITLLAAGAALAQGPAASYTLFGSGCRGSNGTPALAATGGAVPMPGQRFSVTVANVPTSLLDPVYMLIGFDPFVPVLLDPIGMDGCWLLVEPRLVAAMTKNVNTGYRTAEWIVDVPNIPNLGGAHFYNQALCVDQDSAGSVPEGVASSRPNALGLTTSNAGDGVVGDVAAPLVTVRGRVFYDADENGVFDPTVPGEVPIQGWKVNLRNGASADVFTAADGSFEFVWPQSAAPYTLASLPPSPGFVGDPGGRWVPTNPAVRNFTTAGVALVEHDFGCFFLVPNPLVAQSPAFFQGPSGEAQLLACEPAWRIVLNEACLRTNFSNPSGETGTLFLVPPGLAFPQAYQSLVSWLSLPPGDVLAYVLSRMVAAALLNRECGPLSGLTLYVDPQTGGGGALLPFEVVRANTRAVLCDPRSADTGPNGDPVWRAVIAQCLNEWDGLTSNGDGVFVKTLAESDWKTFRSPY